MGVRSALCVIAIAACVFAAVDAQSTYKVGVGRHDVTGPAYGGTLYTYFANFTLLSVAVHRISLLNTRIVATGSAGMEFREVAGTGQRNRARFQPSST